ncbi:type I-E CRISPR-associated protein Cas6/Cse3/CasE [Secundilactobacillus hailunensis]|uniref:Type I-E CRISPR-associated protein Cas6/Cse3/CasE n=1 Tax=Secundilactobacillus hailunensis TaxID=2559923 RepID=A0ABW1T5N7_9LACO|nr:type I-E CRISPR-associated protein Cas6/Cse3/CasE [Secundilactobacillus hailunensis]
MFLSRIKITDKKLQQIQEYTTVEPSHNWDRHVLPGELQPSVPREHYWQFERMNKHWYLYMLSEVAPKGVKVGPTSMSTGLASKANEHLLDSLLADQPIRFRITANPPRTGEASEKLDPQVIVAEQREWLLNQQTKNGFQILRQISVLSNNDENAYVSDVASSNRPILGRQQNGHSEASRVTFAGDLVVKDLLAFEKMTLNGMASSKNFNFGLLTLMPEA